MYARECVRLYYDWIAMVAALPRDDKMLKSQNKKIKHHTQFPSVGGVPRSGGVVRECKNMPLLCSSLSSWGWLPWSSHGVTKRIQSTKNPHMIIFSLQDMWQTNKINTKHVPNPNHRLD